MVEKCQTLKIIEKINNRRTSKKKEELNKNAQLHYVEFMSFHQKSTVRGFEESFDIYFS